MCKYRDDTPGEGCHETLVETRFLSAKDKADVLRLHNEIRTLTQAGKVPGFTAAEKLAPLTWDVELEQIARRWAVQCIYGNDDCRFSKEGDYGRQGSGQVGQNLGRVGDSRVDEPAFPEIIQGWFLEYKKFPPNEITGLSRHLEGTPYTQIVWSTTTRLGCERVFYDAAAGDASDATDLTEYLVCNYGPAGNWVGEKVYDKEFVSQPRKIHVTAPIGATAKGAVHRIGCVAVCLVISLRPVLLSLLSHIP